MAGKIFTDEQLSAIETRDKTLLVSAAAGSGKTATLTERIIRSLLDEKSPKDISRMLIVTFTNAAVDELRERITKALKDRIAEEPDNARLERQLYMLPNAKISTIDAFCNDILKNNAERFGISPSYRIADPAEAGILAHTIWSSLISAAYDGKLDSVTPEDFEELSACLVGVKNDSSLEDIFSMLYEKSKSHEAGVNIYREFTEKIKDYINLPIEENPYGKYGIDTAKEIAHHYRNLYTKLCDRISYLSPTDSKYVEFFKNEKFLFDKITEQSTYLQMREALAADFKTAPQVKNKGELYEVLRTTREDAKKAARACYDRFFSYSVEEWQKHLADLYKLLSTLADFVSEFDRLYFDEKKRRGVLEYSDIERLTYLSLYDKNGNLTELAYATKEQYSDVYIDEYQDVNSLQNKIFEAVSRTDNRFMVGDIKQSIYGFRSARPDIFAKMKDAFPALKESNGSSAASIFMSKNFRCDKGILDFVNDIFHPLFTLVHESIGYVPEDRLEFGKINTGRYVAEAEKRTPEIHLFTNDDKGDDEEKLGDLAPKWVAKKIKELVDNERLTSGERVTPSDIAIILRKDEGRAKEYADALLSVGIAAKLPDSKSVLDSPEIQLALCLLSAIDNPMRDIYLAGLMMSPLYSFTPDELYKIRKPNTSASLWDSLKAYVAENKDFNKGEEFIKALNHYRAIAEGVKVDALIMRLYNETGLLALASRSGCKENLMLLYNYARKFEASSFEGLFSFINYINKLIESGAGFSAPKNPEDESAVTIITIHKSKGLEFPIVFLADAATSLYSTRDKRSRMAFSEDFGIGMKTRVPGGLSLVESPVYNAIIDRNAEKGLEESFRVYYVALTRARERLYLVGGINVKDKTTYLNSSKIRKTHVSLHTLKESKSFVDIMLLFNTRAKITWWCDEPGEQDFVSENTTPCDYSDTPPSKIDLPEIFSDGVGNLSLIESPATTCEASINVDAQIDTPADIDKLYPALIERLQYEYPRKPLTALPEKMSISKLYPTVLDGNDADLQLSVDTNTPQSETAESEKLPEFITGTSEYESALCGIATHNFLQFFKLEGFKAGGATPELNRLVAEKFMSKQDARRVRINEIELFADSKLLADMKNAKQLYREFRFNVMLPAALFTGDEEKKKAFSGKEILLQGVIDCLIEDKDGNLHLVDYKTDRLTRAELSDRALAKAALSQKHALQLTYYALAVEKIFSKKPKTVCIYSLPLGDTVELDINYN